MSKLRIYAAMGIASSMALALPAVAADWIPEPPVIEYPEPEPIYGGWYLRGHIGASNQRLGSLWHPLHDVNGNFEWLDKGGFDSAPIFGGGIGYQVNDYLRLDGIVEYRGKASFSAMDRYHAPGDPTDWQGSNDYDAKKSELLLMANAYADLGDFHGITPYIGAGLGVSRNTISHFRDINVPNNSVYHAGSESTWQLAWALHAGVGIKATDRMTIDLGYSYVNLGDAKTKEAVAYDGSTIEAFRFKDIASHDFKLGVRYSLY